MGAPGFRRILGTFPTVRWSNKRGNDALDSLLRLFGGPLGLYPKGSPNCYNEG
jgi:hypothetical protein